MTMTDPSATISSASQRKIKSGASAPIYSLALLCLAVSCAIPLKAWAVRKIQVEVYPSGSCQTLLVTGTGWGKTPNNVVIAATGLPGLPGTVTIAPKVATFGGLFSFKETFTYMLGCPGFEFVYPKFTATGLNHGNHVSESSSAFENCPINFSPC
jgi:hypothetical protein